MPIKSTYFSRHLFHNRLDWNSLRTLGKSSIVQSSFYWLFLVPIVARMLSEVQSPIIVRIFEQSHSINLTLPFSWYCLYFSALSFAIGSLLYKIYCPPIISEFENFREYLDSGGEGFRLATEIRKAIPSGFIQDSPIWNAFRITVRRVSGNREMADEIEIERELKSIPGDELGSIFYTVRDVVNYSHPGMVRSTAFFFLIGIILLLVVLLQNISFVLIQLNLAFPILRI
jgi:hypothetical protein